MGRFEVYRYYFVVTIHEHGHGNCPSSYESCAIVDASGGWHSQDRLRRYRLEPYSGRSLQQGSIDRCYSDEEYRECHEVEVSPSSYGSKWVRSVSIVAMQVAEDDIFFHRLVPPAEL